jgi:hypothetical protein
MRCGAATLAAMAIAVALTAPAAPDDARATPEDKVIAAGRLKLAGRTMSCGRTPTLISHTFWDYGGATKGRIILNPAKLDQLPEAVRWWIYAHECGHQVYGPGELKADCYAVQRGRRKGWLDDAGMDQVCEFLKDKPADWVHPPGPERCEKMRACYASAKPPSARR